jgi:hypothetical protein
VDVQYVPCIAGRLVGKAAAANAAAAADSAVAVAAAVAATAATAVAVGYLRRRELEVTI